MAKELDTVSDEKTEVRERVRAAAERAKAEAEARRAERDAAKKAAPKEVDGRGGLDPVRYNDWEIKGLTADF